ncbi:winged helix-turn-helix transcriptional regulator [Paraburkholderia bryophila]|uniref:DNA-binding HxlR family transcriptional regulator n=1 Tax=Paraburkholderia bryophila TaxID=420952 RepID=A0A7Y9WRZ3_9BURK|nr:helix-turn-helix domain-containing protein [Paraburkholderia bryophila]NYH25977.1 DNA-binding HxlR family transcriptional regulator [Paraburkholderia bryophila]
MKQRNNSNCPICYSLDIFGDRWTLLIVRDMVANHKQYYREFLGSDEGISTNILADRLKNLVEHGLVTKEDDPENRSQSVYHPTEKALALGPVLEAIMDWGLKYGPESLTPPPGWQAATAAS